MRRGAITMRTRGERTSLRASLRVHDHQFDELVRTLTTSLERNVVQGSTDSRGAAARADGASRATRRPGRDCRRGILAARPVVPLWRRGEEQAQAQEALHETG